MNKTRKKWRRGVIEFFLAVWLLAPVLVSAQGCALCYTQAAGSGSRMIAALRGGILILVIPPMLFCCGISWMAYKKRNQFNDPQNPELSDSTEN